MRAAVHEQGDWLFRLHRDGARPLFSSSGGSSAIVIIANVFTRPEDGTICPKLSDNGNHIDSVCGSQKADVDRVPALAEAVTEYGTAPESAGQSGQSLEDT